MNGFRAAIQFITILPAGGTPAFEPKTMVPFFPVVGLLLGLIVCLGDWIFMQLFPAPVVALLDVILLVILTGAFHLDGLGDSADGLFSHRPREKALLIMKDSRVGIMGLVVIVCVMAIKWAGVSYLNDHRSLTLILVPALARAGMLFGFKLLPYGRPDGGTGHAFFEHELQWRDFWALAIPVLLALFLGVHGVLILIAFFVITLSLLWFYHRKMQCITGDMLGAMVEVLESLLFLVAIIKI